MAKRYRFVAVLVTGVAIPACDAIGPIAVSTLLPILVRSLQIGEAAENPSKEVLVVREHQEP